jgi:hypothetical protein
MGFSPVFTSGVGLGSGAWDSVTSFRQIEGPESVFYYSTEPGGIFGNAKRKMVLLAFGKLPLLIENTATQALRESPAALCLHFKGLSPSPGLG